MRAYPPFQIHQLGGEIFIVEHKLAQLDESAHDEHANFDRSWRIEDARRHDGAVFSECEWQLRRELEFAEVVAFCDHLCFLCGGQLKPEIGRESVLISPNLFVQALGGNAIQASQVGIKDNLLATDIEDQFFNLVCDNQNSVVS